MYKVRWRTKCAPLICVCSSVGRVPGCGSGGHGFDPHQTPKCFNSTVVVQLPCNEQVVGPNPT